MMNKDVRGLFEEIIDVLNRYDVLMETKRLILVVVLQMIEKKADEAINNEYSAMNMEAENAESIFQNKLGELSE